MSFDNLEGSIFEWKDLHGKDLKIIVSEDKNSDDEDVRLIFGRDKNGKIYLLHWEGCLGN